MKRTAVAMLLLCACGRHSSTAPKPPAPPVRVAVGDWQVSPTESFPGKQDDLYFSSPTRGFYGNGAGKIFRTDDAGRSWQNVMEQPGTFVRAIGFLDDQRGFAGNLGPDAFPGVTDPQLLYRTDDGGQSWRPVALPDAEGARGVCAIDILAVDAVNAGHRWHKELVHVGGRVGGPAALFRSDDGGTTWSRLKLPPEVAMILDVHFVDVSTGFVFAGSDPDVSVSNGLIVRTVDAGRTWSVVYRSQRPFELMWKASFPSRTVGYASLQNYSAEAGADPSSGVTAVGDRFVVKTTDGGATWVELPMVTDPSVQELGIGFIDQRHGWVGAMPHGFETVDGGATWKTIDTLPVAANKFRIVTDGDRAEVWTIGKDVRHLSFAPAVR
jgi:photosystem II stability/assembly factor-like uncharacterized protein